MKTINLLILVLLAQHPLFAQEKSFKDFKKDKLLFQETFNSLSSDNWKAESPVAKQASISAINGKLVIDAPGGATLWYSKKLSGNYLIEYKRKVIMDGGKNDRLSDLNNFWMASDPKNQNIFTRTGVLEEYDSLKLYYSGMGGNTNSTTRFRKYEGDGRRTLLKEYKDKEHLLTANKEYLITLICYNGETRFCCDGMEFFRFTDPEPLTEGYFGFRCTWSRQEIDDVKIYSLK